MTLSNTTLSYLESIFDIIHAVALNLDIEAHNDVLVDSNRFLVIIGKTDFLWPFIRCELNAAIKAIYDRSIYVNPLYSL